MKGLLSRQTFASYFSYKRALYQRYEAYITDILTYTESEIDHEDLKNCTKTLERSKAFDKLELFMDGIKEDFDIHYLYILTLVDESHIMSVISAENYYDRYIDTEGNLYLGWISDDEYDEGDVAPLSQALNTDGITFFEQDTCVEDVFKRADKEMYKCKEEMHAVRE